MRSSRLTLLWLGLLTLSLVGSGVVAYRVMKQPTGPRLLRWFDHQQLPLFAQAKPLHVSSCQGDRHFRSLSLGHHLWTVCLQGVYTPRHHSRYTSGVYVRFDMARKFAHAAWPVPKEYALYHTLGLLPNARGQLGIVYRSQHLHGPLVVAVAGKQGWRVPPQPLPEPYSGRLLGMRWLLGRLAVVASASHPMDRLGLRSSVAMFHLPQGHDSPLRRPSIRKLTPVIRGFERLVFPRPILCQGQKPCRIELAYPGGSPATWKFMVLQKQAWEVTLRASVARAAPSPRPAQTTRPSHQATRPTTRHRRTNRAGQPEVTPQYAPQHTTWQARHRRRKDWDAYRLWLRRRLDISVTGILPQAALALEYRWQPKGPPTLLDSLKGWSDNNLIRQAGHFVYEAGQLRLRTWWLHPPHAVIHRVDQQRMRLSYRRPSRQADRPTRFLHSRQNRYTVRPVKVRPVSLRLQRIETWRTRDLGVSSRFPPRTCPSLMTGGWVSRPQQQGYWLVSPSGCYLALDASWQRSDPLSLREHLKRRAQAEHRALPSFFSLAWLVFGGPLCLLVGWLLQRPSSTPSEAAGFWYRWLLPCLWLGLFLVTAIYPWFLWSTLLF